MDVQTCNNYYEAKFFREAQTNPSDWVITPTRDRRRYTVVNMGVYPMNRPLTDREEAIEAAMEKAEQETVDYMTREEAGIRLALMQFATQCYDNVELVKEFAHAIATSNASATAPTGKLRSVLEDLANDFIATEGRPLTFDEIRRERDDVIKSASDCGVSDV